MKIEIRPALQPIIRHGLQTLLGAVVKGVGVVDGGETAVDGTSCSIYIYPIEDKTEMDLRHALTGSFEEPPWPLPPFDPEARGLLPKNLPSEVEPKETGE